MLFEIMCAIQYLLVWSRCGVDIGRTAPEAQEPVLSTDCARYLSSRLSLPLQMKMGTVSTDAAAVVNYRLDKGPLPRVGEGGCARPAARHIDGARAGGGVITRVWTSHR